MKKAIVGSSSLIFMFKDQRIVALLKKIYSVLLIPKEVKEEVIDSGKKLNLNVTPIEEELNSFLELIEVKNIKKDLELGKGETACIYAALKLKFPVISDDRKARFVGKHLGVKIIHLSSFLIYGVKNKILNKSEAIQILENLLVCGYRLKSEVYIEIKRTIESM